MIQGNYEEFGQSRPQVKNRQIIMFEEKAEKNEAKTLADKTPRYDMVTYIAIQNLGSRDRFITKFNDHYKQLYSREYDHWLKTKEPLVEGTPLSEFAFLNSAHVMELKAVGIHTVEQLADVPDGNVHRVPGGMNFKLKAKAYLDTIRDASTPVALAQENSLLKERIADLEAKLEEVIAKVSASGKKPKKV